MVSYDLQIKTWHSWLTFLLITKLSRMSQLESIYKHMRKILFSLSLVSGLLTTACSDDNTAFNEPSPIRAYETDAEILTRFVDVDNVTGVFFINPDKKITASDYVVNRSREELMMVSTVNRDKFTREMDDVNSMLRAIKRSGISTAIIYSTYSSDKLIEGSLSDKFKIEKLAVPSKSGNPLAQITVTSERNDARQFYAPRYVTMDVSANSLSKFYLYQISLGDISNPDVGILIIAGLNTPKPNHSYIITNNGNFDWLSVKGMNLVGDGTLSVSFVQ